MYAYTYGDAESLINLLLVRWDALVFTLNISWLAGFIVNCYCLWNTRPFFPSFSSLVPFYLHVYLCEFAKTKFIFGTVHFVWDNNEEY